MECSWTSKFVFIVCVGRVLSLHGKGAYYVPSPPGARPPCARGSLICESIDTYPEELIQKLLQSKSLELSSLFVDEREGMEEPPAHFLKQETFTPSTVSNYSPNRRFRRSLPEKIIFQSGRKVKDGNAKGSFYSKLLRTFVDSGSLSPKIIRTARTKL